LIQGGRALKRLGPIPGYQTLSNSEYLVVQQGSQTMGDKILGREGNSPDHQLRSPNNAEWERKWIFTDNRDVGLEAATI
jgi:hypothetical protein